jgi:UDP-GlcNAc:undecaprenyl-phosphate GlcNAc-1-phosphate transferase
MPTLFDIVLSFGIPLLLSLLITPIVITIAHRIGAIDPPGERKIHLQPMPRLGGVAIYASLLLSLLALYPLVPMLHSISRFDPQQVLLLAGSFLLILGTGIWDDIRPLNPGHKFAAQVLAATIVYLAGFHIPALTNLLGSNLFELGFLDYPVTVLWIVGVTNAFNLIDGLDGLASGIAAISAVAICAISVLSHHYAIAVISICLAGALAGFLRYNFNPARVFLGDSGSLLIGFALALLSIQSSTKGSTAFTILIPILALGLPIMDTLVSTIRRILSSLPPFAPGSGPLLRKLHAVVTPDKRHIHHRLISQGLPHRRAVIVMYGVSCAFGAAAFALQISNSAANSLIVLGIAAGSIVGVQKLKYREMAILRNGALLPIYESPLLHRPAFLGILDILFILLSYWASLALTGRGAECFSGDGLLSLGAFGLVQLALFYLCGLYRETMRLFGVGDLLKVLKAVAAAVGLTWILSTALSPRAAGLGFTGFILDFYFLFSMVAGTRVSFPVLKYLSRREETRGKRVLIYGAGTDGVLILQKILNDQTPGLVPVGFLDDDPELEGKTVNGYPVFGGHWKLGSLLRKTRIDQLLIASRSIKPAILKRLEGSARLRGIVVRQSRIRLEELKVHEPEKQKAGAAVSRPETILAVEEV